MFVVAVEYMDLTLSLLDEASYSGPSNISSLSISHSPKSPLSAPHNYASSRPPLPLADLHP